MLKVVSVAAGAALLLLLKGEGLLAGRGPTDKHHFAAIATRVLDRAIISIKRIFFQRA